MTRFITFLAILLSAVSISAEVIITGSSKTVTVPVNISTNTVTHLVTSTMIDIEYTDSPTLSAQLTANENLVKYVSVICNNGTLTVKFKDPINMDGNCHVKLFISGPDVRIFETKSMGSIDITNSFTRKGKEVEIITRSMGSITGKDIKGGQVKMKTHSMGSIKFGSVECSDATLEINSMGSIEINDLISPTVSLTTNSQGGIMVNKIVCNRLDSSTKSMGDVIVKSANSETITATCSSMGGVKISDIAATSVVATSGSQGDIILRGVCENAEFSASGMSSIKASELKAKSVKATINSKMAKITCYATERLIENKYENSSIRNYAK